MPDGRADGAERLTPAPRTSVRDDLYDDPTIPARRLGGGGVPAEGFSATSCALRITAEGGATIAPSLLPELLKRLSRPGAEGPDRACEYEGLLSDRERQVLALIAEGLTNQEIAERLIVSPTTIKTHVQNILQKLDVSDRTQAAVYAVRCGLI